jgi:hypothetical protein
MLQVECQGERVTVCRCTILFVGRFEAKSSMHASSLGEADYGFQADGRPTGHYPGRGEHPTMGMVGDNPVINELANPILVP